MQQPDVVICDSLLRQGVSARHQLTAGILDDLRQAGWHLLSTPELTQRTEVLSGFPPACEVFELQAQLDNEILTTTHAVHKMLLESKISPMPTLKTRLAHNLMRAIGRSLGLEGLGAE